MYKKEGKKWLTLIIIMNKLDMLDFCNCRPGNLEVADYMCAGASNY